MPNSKSNREDKNRRGKLSKKSSSFHSQATEIMPVHELRRPRTVPDLLSGRKDSCLSPVGPRQLTKLLLNVTALGSVGAVQVVMALDSTVGDLISAAVKQFVKEGRRPNFQKSDPAGFDLHYSQFSLESLDREEKIMMLGSRNFFLCPKKQVMEGGDETASSASSCIEEAQKVTKTNSWLRFFDFVL